jgi:hypothetical protein
MESMKTVVEFHLTGLSPELETKLREMIAAGKKPADVEFEINKVILANYMREHKIDLVVAEYEGSGDSGGVEYVTFFREGHQVDAPQGRTPLVGADRIYQKEGETIRIKAVEVGASDAFSLPVYSALDLCGHRGWEIDDGGYGEVRFTLASPQDEAVAVKITHNAYITEVETDEYDL